MRHSHHSEQLVLHPIERVFALFADPYNLPSLMPAWQRPRIAAATIVPPPPGLLSSPATTAAAGVGTHITLSFRPLLWAPLRLSWVAEITEFVWNDHFCDRQMRGPFAYWSHCHRLRAVNRSGIAVTLVADQVDYELPLGALGELAHRLFVRRQIERAFAYRQTRLAELLAVSSQEAAV
jgi:ligand-binding SRPBCC domain-containing protein